MTITTPLGDLEVPTTLLVDGEFTDAASGATFETFNPATGEVLAHLAEGTAVDVDRAVTAARRAFDEGPWSQMRPYDRQRILLSFVELFDRHYEEIARLDTLDMGAPLTRMLGNRRRALGMAAFYAGLATAVRGETIDNSVPGEFLTYTLREPVGVVGAIVPWNNPHIAFTWKVCAALAAGCTVVLKPAEEASLSSLRLAQLLTEAGLPPGVLNVVTGFGETAGAALAGHDGVDKIAFTGSTATGQSIVRASAGNLKRLSLELGGKSPDIVFADADLAAAIPGAAMAAFGNSGQVCSAGTRLFVQREVYDEFIDKVCRFAEGLVVGDGLDPLTQLGPLVSETQLSRVTGYLDQGRRDGASVRTGGSRLTDASRAQGYFVAPTVFAEVSEAMSIVREEIFGPVLAAMPFDTEDEVVTRANATPYGLGAGVWTRDVGRAHRVSRRLHAGSVWVNCYQLMDPAVPFGGYKMSGYGRESGVAHLEEFTEVKSVWVNSSI
jgi:aldehyde dehydrogenase (NAD+)